MELLRELIVPSYIREVKMSEKRRPTFYELKSRVKLPKYLQNEKKYIWKAHIYRKKSVVLLTDKSTGAPVIKNSKSVGTPKYKVINGQYIYSGDIVKEQRNKIMQEVKDYFAFFVNSMERIPKEYLPIRIECEVHHPYLGTNGMPWDVDNHFYIYQKAFQDVLSGHRDKFKEARCKSIIPDDHALFVSKPPSPLHIPVSTFEERKLVFKIYKECDERILKFNGREELFDKFINQYDEHYRFIRR